MNRDTTIFWTIFGILISASIFFGFGAEKQRHLLHHSGARLETGDLVILDRVVDGDSVVVIKDTGKATVRIVGIKAFTAKVEKDEAAIFGKTAIEEIEKMMASNPVRVILHTQPKDTHGRFLATLYVNEGDVAIHLIRKGLVLVYSAYPFPAMPIYLHEQELARGGNRGIWGNTEVKMRALALISEWQEQRK